MGVERKDFTLPMMLQSAGWKDRRRKHTHPFNGPLSGTTQVSRYQKGKTNLDFTEARDSEWQWHQLGHMQVCTLLQTDNHASTPPLGDGSTRGITIFDLTVVCETVLLMSGPGRDCARSCTASRI